MTKELVSNRKLKFLFVSSDKYPPFRVDTTILFGKEIVGRGHSIDWILQSEAPCHVPFQTTWSGSRVWVGKTNTGTSRLSRLRKHIYDILHSFTIFELLRQNEYDFIQVKDKFVVALIVIVAAVIYRKNVVYWLSYPFPEAYLYAVHDGTARYPLFYYFRGMFSKFILYHIIMPRADHVFVQSEQMKRDIVAKGIASEKLTPVPMGTSLEVLPDTKEENREEFGTRGPCVVYLGTLIKARRIDFLIRVFSQVVQEVPEAKLYLIGEGDDPSDLQLLKDEVKRLYILDSVIFTGFLPRKTALDIVKQATVCVSPFYPSPILNSTSPTKLVEYMAMGKAVVANNHPEQRLIIEQSGGGICVPYQEKAFADAIVELLHHPARANEMGKQGMRYVFKHRSYTKIADMLECQYFRITADYYCAQGIVR